MGTITTEAGTVWPLTDDGKLLVLRTSDAQRRSFHNGWQWPDVGETAVAPDWDPNPERDCGGGLHGLLWGVGYAGYLTNTDNNTAWMVVAVDPADVANLDAPGKIRFRTGTVALVTADHSEATGYLCRHGAAGLAVAYGTATAGYWGTATAGYRGTATAGYRGTATAGDWGTATAGDWGTATAGDRGTATAGDWGTLVFRWWDHANDRERTTVAYIGENGIEPDVAYRCVQGVIEPVKGA